MIQAKRADRVGPLIHRELSDVLATKTKDPRLELVTITGVSLTDDLRSARVYFCVAEGDERKESVLAGLQSAAGYLKRELGARLALRFIPELKFVYDESFDRAAYLDKVIKEIHDEDEPGD